jgi:hypothetical protein
LDSVVVYFSLSVIGEDGRYMSTKLVDTFTLQQRYLRGIAQGIVEGKLDLILRMFKFGLDVGAVSKLSGVDSSFLEKVHSFPDISLEKAIKLYYSVINTDKK